MKTVRASLILVISLTILPIAPAQQPSDEIARVDRIFDRWDSTRTPGCAVAIARDSRTILSRAYGMADLEHDVANTPGTIFEAGSVSKQVAAGAIVLLAQDGKLSLDDEVRKYVPELPDYGMPLRIRHMMNHTSGLRDWGSVAAISGWGRGLRVHTQAHVLDIVSRQRALNFPPGNEYSYSNTGYNLLAIIVGRVSGMSFAEFTTKRFFEPLGMTHTQWRDDFRRIVKGRAVAYGSTREGGFATDMPFENVYGNCGLLTTVGDLLIWTENLATGKLGGRPFLEAMHRQGRLNNGQLITYASGLRVTSYKGVPEVSHTGSTAGYRAFVGRYPQQHLAVAVLCNIGSVNSAGLGHQVADVFLGAAGRDSSTEDAVGKPAQLSQGELSSKSGLYRETTTGEPLRLVFTDGQLRLERGGVLIPVSSNEFRVGSDGRRLTFEPSPGDARPRIRETRKPAEDAVYEPVPEFKPTVAELSAYLGEFYSPDAETTLTAAIEEERLVLRRRPDTHIVLTPLYRDAFNGSLGLTRFMRDSNGRVTQLSVRQERVYDLRFDRVR
jgi:CubicO group peptidase (beta-lactamase class C family)